MTIKREAQAVRDEDEEHTQLGQRSSSTHAETDRIQVLEKENRELHEQVQRFNASISEFTAFKNHMTTFVQNITGNQTATALSLSSAPIPAPGANITTSESSPRATRIKRELMKEEDHDDLVGYASTATNRSSKRSKVIDLTAD